VNKCLGLWCVFLVKKWENVKYFVNLYKEVKVAICRVALKEEKIVLENEFERSSTFTSLQSFVRLVVAHQSQRRRRQRHPLQRVQEIWWHQVPLRRTGLQANEKYTNIEVLEMPKQRQLKARSNSCHNHQCHLFMWIAGMSEIEFLVNIF